MLWFSRLTRKKNVTPRRVSLLNLVDNFIWNAALSWFRFVEEHNDINQITFNELNLSPGPVNGTGWNTVARRKDTAINFLSGLSHEGPLKHQTSWRKTRGWKLSTLLILVQRWWARKTWKISGHMGLISAELMSRCVWIPFNGYISSHSRDYPEMCLDV